MTGWSGESIGFRFLPVSYRCCLYPFDVQTFGASFLHVWSHLRIYRHAKLLYDHVCETRFTHNESQRFFVVGVLMFVSLPENRIHELHLGLVDLAEPPVPPTFDSAIQWPHLCQQLPRAGVRSQVDTRIRHHDPQNASRFETAQAFAKKRVCFGVEIKMFEKVLRVDCRDRAIGKGQAPPAVPKGTRRDGK